MRHVRGVHRSRARARRSCEERLHRSHRARTSLASRRRHGRSHRTPRVREASRHRSIESRFLRHGGKTRAPTSARARDGACAHTSIGIHRALAPNRSSTRARCECTKRAKKSHHFASRTAIETRPRRAVRDEHTWRQLVSTRSRGRHVTHRRRDASRARFVPTKVRATRHAATMMRTFSASTSS